MRKVLISLAVAASALAVASPASAQFYPQPRAPQGYGYGYHNNYGQVRNLQVRVDSIQRQIERLRQRRAISRNESRDLRSEASNVERRLRLSSRYGLNPRERQNIEIRIARLEQHVRHEVRDGRRNWTPYVYNQNSYGYFDRDRDGRDDRYEDDRGRRHD
jgi:regulator of replication initiation timing